MAPNAFSTLSLRFVDEACLVSSGKGFLDMWRFLGMDNETSSEEWEGCVERLAGVFGLVEETDIEDVVVLTTSSTPTPTTTLISTSSEGRLLVWHNAVLVGVAQMATGLPLHERRIRQVRFENNELYTAGDDNFVRVWDVRQLLQVPHKELNPQWTVAIIHMEPIHELRLDERTDIIAMIKMVTDRKESDEESDESNVWCLQDGRGRLWRVDLTLSLRTSKPKVLLEAHSESVQLLLGHDDQHVVVSAGRDGRLALFDLDQGVLIHHLLLQQAITALQWIDVKNNLLLVGTSKGFVSLVTIRAEDRRKANLRTLALALRAKLEVLTWSRPFEEPLSHFCMMTTSALQSTFVAMSSESCFIISVDLSTPQATMKPLQSFVMDKAILAMNTLEVNKVIQVSKEGDVLIMHLDNHMAELDEHRDSYVVSTPEIVHQWRLEAKGSLELGQVVISIREMEITLVWTAWDKHIEKAFVTVINFDHHNCLTNTSQLWQEPSADYCPLRSLNTTSTLRLHDRMLLRGQSDGSVVISELVVASEHVRHRQLVRVRVHDGPVRDVVIVSSRQVVTAGVDGDVVVHHINEDDKKEQVHLDDDEHNNVANKERSGRLLWRRSSPKSSRPTSGRSNALNLTSGPSSTSARGSASSTSLEWSTCYPSWETERRERRRSERVRRDEQTKRRIRRRLNQLKLSFQDLVKRHSSLPPDFQLDRLRLWTCPHVMRAMEKRHALAMAELRLEHEKDEREMEVVMDKLRHRFFENILEKEITVRGIADNELLVRSFRLEKEVDDHDADHLHEEEDKKAEEDMEPKREDYNEMELRKLEEEFNLFLETEAALPRDSIRSDVNVSVIKDARVMKELGRQEERRRRRKLRQREWEQLMAMRPKRGLEKTASSTLFSSSVAQRRARGAALKNNGGLVRKTSDLNAHETPRLTSHLEAIIEGSRNQMEERKRSFNTEIHQLLNEKLSVLSNLAGLSENLMSVQTKLEVSHRKAIPFLPFMTEDELTKDPFEIDVALLARLKEDIVRREEEKSKDALLFGGQSNRSRSSSITSLHTPLSKALGMEKSEHNVDKGSKGKLGSLVEENDDDDDVDHDQGDEEQEMHRKSSSLTLKRAEQDRLLSEMRYQMSQWDSRLVCMRNKRLELEVQNIQTLLTIQSRMAELKIVREMQPKEDQLFQKRSRAQNKLSHVLKEIAQKQQLKALIDSQMERLRTRCEALHAWLEDELRDDKHRVFLNAVYNKNRDEERRQRNGSNKDDRHFVSVVRQELNFDPESGLPDHIDLRVLDAVVNLRNKRDKLRQQLREKSRRSSELQCDLGFLQLQRGQVEQQVEKCCDDLHQYRVHKMSQLNSVAYTLVLRRHQLQLSSKWTSPLVMSSSRYRELEERIAALKNQNNEIKRGIKETQQSLNETNERQKSMNNELLTLKIRCKALIEAKFSLTKEQREECNVDNVMTLWMSTLERLEAIRANRAMEELREEAKEKERKHYATIKQLNVAMERTQSELRAEIVRGTEILETKRQERLLTTHLKK